MPRGEVGGGQGCQTSVSVMTFEKTSKKRIKKYISGQSGCFSYSFVAKLYFQSLVELRLGIFIDLNGLFRLVYARISQTLIC